MARPSTIRRPDAAPRRARWVALMLAAMFIAATAAIGQTWTNLQVIDYGYKISKATRQRAQLQEANRRLRIELAVLKRPERIARLAAEGGLRPPEPRQLRRLTLPGASTNAPGGPANRRATPRPDADQRPVALTAAQPPTE